MHLDAVTHVVLSHQYTPFHSCQADDNLPLTYALDVFPDLFLTLLILHKLSLLFTETMQTHGEWQSQGVCLIHLPSPVLNYLDTPMQDLNKSYQDTNLANYCVAIDLANAAK